MNQTAYRYALLTACLTTALSFGAYAEQKPRIVDRPDVGAPSCLHASHGSNDQSGTTESLQLSELIDSSFEAMFARFEQSRARFGSVQHPLNPSPTRVNEEFTHRRTLISASDRMVTTPNNDTLYSAAWVQLENGPVELHLPRMPEDRYWSMAVLDIDTDNIAIFGSGTKTPTPLNVVLVPSHYKGPVPAGSTRVVTPGSDVQLLVRILVNDVKDIESVGVLQAGMSIRPLAKNSSGQFPVRTEPKSSRDPANFLSVVNESLERNPFPSSRSEQLASWRAVGIGVHAPAFEELPAPVQSLWCSRIDSLNDQLRDGLGHGSQTVHGWRVPDPNVGSAGEDDGLRASVALGALGALSSSEAVYLQLDVDPQSGSILDGKKAWELDIPAIEARGFWSISMYEVDDQGRFFFADNDIHRYAIGNRTKGLKKQPNGSLRLSLQTDSPADPSNWLPTPPGRFAMVLRVYLPSEDMRKGLAPLPLLRQLTR